MENCRLLMCICSNASMPCGVPMVHSMRLIGFHLHIYGVDPSEVYEVAYGFLFCYTKLLFLFVIFSSTRFYRSTKVEKLWRDAFRSLYSYSSLQDIVCLKMTFVLTYKVS